MTDTAALTTLCRCSHRLGLHDELMANGEPCCALCGCDDFEPICGCKWTPGIDLPTTECDKHRDAKLSKVLPERPLP